MGLGEVSNESTSVPPWVLAFGFLPRGPLAILQESWCDEQQLPPNLGKAPHAYLMELRDNLERAQDYASQHVQNAQKKYVHRYNLRSCEKSFVPGDKVLILRKDTTSSKTFSSWIGPAEIIEVKSPSSYLVEVDGARRVIMSMICASITFVLIMHSVIICALGCHSTTLVLVLAQLTLVQ